MTAGVLVKDTENSRIYMDMDMSMSMAMHSVVGHEGAIFRHIT